MLKSTAVAISVVTLSGCAGYSNQVIDSKTEESFRNHTIVLTTRKKPDFSAYTAGKVALGGGCSVVLQVSALVMHLLRSTAFPTRPMP